MPVEPRPAGGRGGPPVRNRGALVFGGAFIAAGIGIALRSRLASDPDAALAIGIAFAVGGLAYVRHGLRGLREAKRTATVLAEVPGQPWLADHPWRAEGALDEAGDDGKEILATGLRILAVAAAVAYGLWTFASSKRDDRFALAFATVGTLPVALMAFGALWAIASGATRLRRRKVHGPSELRYRGFPFFVGGALEGELLRDPRGPRLVEVSATLRCVQEVWVRSRRGHRSTRWDVLHEETRRFPAAGPPGRFPIRFELPPDPALGTALAPKPPRYWELVVTADARPANFVSKFLVPVYARPGQDSADRVEAGVPG
jgi:hypothetical protein